MSALVHAALKGEVAVLDNIDRLAPTLLNSLSSLIQSREMHLFHGKRLIPHTRFDALVNDAMEEHQLTREQAAQYLTDEVGVWRVHPSFRIIATSSPSGSGSGAKQHGETFSPEIVPLFRYH